MKSSCRLFAVAVACMIGIAAGCKKTYKDPTAFLEKCLIEDYVQKKWSAEFMKCNKFKTVEMTNVRLESAGLFTAVCADVRFVPDSDKTVYVEVPISLRGETHPYGMAKVLSAENLRDHLTAEVKIPRVELDDGVFAPQKGMVSSGSDVQGWGLVGYIEPFNAKKAEQELRHLSEEVKTVSTIDARLRDLVERISHYKDNGQLQYIGDKKLLKQYANAVASLMALAWRNKDEFKARAGKESAAALADIAEEIEKGGITVELPSEMKKDIDTRISFAKMEELGCGFMTCLNVAESQMGEDALPKAVQGHKSAGDYFRSLLRKNKDNPIFAAESMFEFDTSSGKKKIGQPLWSIALDGPASWERERRDCPILISANFNCRELCKTWNARNKDADKVIPIGTCPLIGNSGIVVVYGNGRAKSLPANKVTLRNIYGDTPIRSLPRQYLTLHGVEDVRKD